MDVYWLEQAEAEVPAGDEWLGEHEAARLSGMRFAKRRADWRLGRWTAKNAVAMSLGLARHHRALREVEIRAAPSGAPEVFLCGERMPATISLSHRAGRGICAVSVSGGDLGCDLELVEPRSDAFLADYFTAEERRLVANAPAPDRFRLGTLIWSAKESALKALAAGLRFDTRAVAVAVAGAAGDGWSRLTVASAGGPVFQGWWQVTGDLVRTVVSAPPPNVPLALGHA